MKNDWANLINVASESVGTKSIFVSDDFFAPVSRMLQDSAPVFIEDKYDDNGKWMDGWESRRRRDGKNDYCILKLGAKSIISGFDVDTSHFTGNFAPAVYIMGANLNIEDDEIIQRDEDIKWIDLSKVHTLEKDSQNIIHAIEKKEVTHLKISILPDGGIARFRAYGQISFDDCLYEKNDINVLSINTGARVIKANNEHFGFLRNILFDHKPKGMMDGWETRRRREPGNDWGLIELSRPAIIDNIIVDTSFFKGNFPASISICSDYIEKTTDEAVVSQSMFWDHLMDKKKLKMNALHNFSNKELEHNNKITHIRVNIFPDGGIARLKLIGRFIKDG